MDLKSQVLRADFPLEPDSITGELGRRGPGELNIELVVVGQPEEVASIAELFRQQPGSSAWLAQLCSALGIGVPMFRGALRSRLLLRADEADRQEKVARAQGTQQLGFESAVACARKDAFREAAAMLEEHAA